jgi:LacI family transcriptional regulator
MAINRQKKNAGRPTNGRPEISGHTLEQHDVHKPSTKKQRQVAVIVDTQKAYHRKILRGIGAYVHEVGNWSLYIEEEPLHKLPDLNHWQGDGIILSFWIWSLSKAACQPKLPTVGIEGRGPFYDPAWKIPSFNTDDKEIGRLGAKHLIERGFSRLAFCGYPTDPLRPWSEERAAGFLEYAAEQNVACIVRKGHYKTVRKWINMQHELTVWLESLEKPVGLMAANDARARHVLEACRAIGLRVPEDVAVLGVDNDDVICELTDPPLSSIEHGAASLGYQAAALLDRLMDGKKAKLMTTYVPPKEVVMRRSTDILAIEDPEVAAAMAYIHENSCRPIRIADVVDAVQVSRSTLETKFKAVTGRTIHGEIRRLQIDCVRSLLATTDLPIKQIAAMAGFAHIHYMTTIFHQQTGWTPAEYRKHVKI